jgi:VCBS repeat protein
MIRNASFAAGSPAALLLLVLAIPAAADPLFSRGSSFDTGWYPRGVAIADLDGDGHLDLVTANQAANTVSILLGNGDGTFRARTDFEAGGRPLSVAVADLNADGRPDLAVAGEGYDPDYAGRISVLLGNGDGTFGTRTQYGVPQWPQAVAIADMNGDMRPDLVVPSGNPTNKLSVLPGMGGGTFGPSAAFGTADFPSSVAIADLDGDGGLDVAITNLNSNSVSVFVGNGDGTLGVRSDFGTGVGPWSVEIADVNGDGKLDLVVANFDSNTVSALLGNGDGTFGPRLDFAVGVNPRCVAVADVNGDGFPDIATANDGLPDTPEGYPGSYFLTLLLGDGTGGFGQRADFDTGIHPWAVAIADLNSDGYPDLSASNTGSSTVSVLLHRTPVRMGFAFAPGTLELSSRGRWVTGFLEPDPPLAATEIDIASIRLNETVPVDPDAPTSIGDHDGDGVPDLMVKFDRRLVLATLAAGGRVPITVTGTVNGQTFSGTGYVVVRATKAPVPIPAEAPRAELAIRRTGPYAGGRARVEFALRDQSPARLELLDVAGRVLVTRQVGGVGPGQHSVDLAAGRSVPPGVYFVRLTQAGTRVPARIAVLR